MLSLNTICFQAICRDYRNAVVSHIRTAFQAEYADDWESRIISPFQKEWEENHAKAQVSRKSGQHEAQLRDEADLLGVNHFFNLFENHFDVLFPRSEGQSDTDRKALKQAVLGWARNIKVMRDPVTGHPGEDDIAEKDAMMMLDAAWRILGALHLNAAGDVVHVWWERVRSSEFIPDIDEADDVRKLEGSILPTRESVAPKFVGRQAELEALRQWLVDDHSRSWFLVGDGGKGKTAIAYEFAVYTRDNPPDQLEMVIWLTAKVQKFAVGAGIEVNAPDFWDLESALAGILTAYGVPGAEEMNLDDKRRECLEYLTHLPALVILDDVDSLEGEGIAAMNFFLFQAAATPTKILLTSRRIAHYGMEPMTTQVEGFTVGSSDGLDFVRTRLEMFRLDPEQFPTGTKTRILEVCDGSPLFIQDLLRFCKVGETPLAAIEKWVIDGGEEARRYALGREFEKLSEAARKVLLGCSLYPGSASLPEIRVITALSEANCQEAIAELQNLFLVPRPRLIEDVPRFALNTNTRRLVVDVLGNSDLATRIGNSIDALIGNVPASLDQRRRIGQFIQQAVSQGKLGEHKAAEDTVLQALEIYPENADLHGQLGRVYKFWQPVPRITDARIRFSRAAELKSSKEDMYFHWAQMESKQAEWSSAAAAAEKGLEIIGESPRLSSFSGYARSRLARDLNQQTQYNRADQEARRAEAHLKNALVDIDDIEQGYYGRQSKDHRAMAINYDLLIRINRSLREHGAELHFTRLLADCLKRWNREHPSDTEAVSETERCLRWYPELADYGLTIG